MLIAVKQFSTKRSSPTETGLIFVLVAMEDLMNERLKSTLKYAGVFLIGLFIGAFLLETLEIYLRSSYRDLVA